MRMLAPLPCSGRRKLFVSELFHLQEGDYYIWIWLVKILFVHFFSRNENTLASTLKTLLFFTALMITVPIGLYFTTKSYVFEGALGMSNRDSYFYAAIVAVVAVHVVLALFVYVAWNEGSRQWREGKQD